MVVMTVPVVMAAALAAMLVGVCMFVLVVMIMRVVVVVAHASLPFAGSAMCSSISLSTPLMWASAAE